MFAPVAIEIGNCHGTLQAQILIQQFIDHIGVAAHAEEDDGLLGPATFDVDLTLTAIRIAARGPAVGKSYAGAAIPGFDRIDASVQHLRDHMREMPMLVVPLFAGRTEEASVFASLTQAVLAELGAQEDEGPEITIS